MLVIDGTGGLDDASPVEGSVSFCNPAVGALFGEPLLVSLKLQQRELSPVAVDGLDAAKALTQDWDEREPGNHRRSARGTFESSCAANGIHQHGWRGQCDVASFDGEAADGVMPKHYLGEHELAVKAILGVEPSEQFPAVVVGDGNERCCSTAVVIDRDCKHPRASWPQATGSHQATSGR